MGPAPEPHAHALNVGLLAEGLAAGLEVGEGLGAQTRPSFAKPGLPRIAMWVFGGAPRQIR